MERVVRNRKAFDEKENDHKHLNKKPSMLASLNYKSNNLEHHPLKVLPNISNAGNINAHYESVSYHNERPSLTKNAGKYPVARKSFTPAVEECSNTKAYCKIYSRDLELYLSECLAGTCESFLTGHQITSSLRARMLDWMVEVTESYKFTSKTYFASVEIMDRYFARECLAVPV